MVVSIVICTSNRAESLGDTLLSIGKLSIPANVDVECVLVNNASSDYTVGVISNRNCGKIQMRYLEEQKLGKAWALNRALVEANGEVILFTDDDVRVPANWLQTMLAAIVERDADAVAGKVVFPHSVGLALNASSLANRPSWFASTEEIDASRPQRMVGANMAIHRRVLRYVGAFDVCLGPGALGFYEDSLFSWQLLKNNCKIVSAFDVAAEHYFDTKRLSDNSLVEIAKKMGQSRAYIFHHWDHQKSNLVVPRLIRCECARWWRRQKRKKDGDRIGRLTLQDIKLEEERAFYRKYLAIRQSVRKY